jgi:hypothetical protein
MLSTAQHFFFLLLTLVVVVVFVHDSYQYVFLVYGNDSFITCYFKRSLYNYTCEQNNTACI